MSDTPQERDTLPPGPDLRTLTAIEDGFAPGTLLGGKYRITAEIGRGGLGVVLAATHEQLDQRVAIKHLQPDSLARPVVVERFLREARLAARVRSDHVARIYDVETTELGCPYIVMEYLEGRDLGDVLASERCIPVELAVDYVLQACEALAEAHTLGIVHRDLKPENMFLARRAGGKEVLKILDFGISKLSEKVPGAARESKLTSDQETFGTPNYMSPELLQSASDVDARSDIWALGIIFYELLSGQAPFEGTDLPQLCLAIVNKPVPPLRALCPDVPAALEATILKCLAKDREARYRNVGELAQDLEAFAPASSVARVEHVRQVVLESGESVRPPASRARLPFLSQPSYGDGRRRTGLLAFAAVGAVSGLIGTVAFMLRHPEPTPVIVAAPPVVSVSPPVGIYPPVPPPVASTAPDPAPEPTTASPSATVSAEPHAVAAPSAVPRHAASSMPRPLARPPASAGESTAKKHAEFGDRQ